MGTLKGRPTAWRPKLNQWFDAYLRRHNKLHPAGPFKCIGFERSSQAAQALDAEGDTWAFKLRDFHLVPQVKPQAETQKTAGNSQTM